MLVDLRSRLDTGTIGPVTTMAIFTGALGALTPAMHGLVVSFVLLSAALASLFSGMVSDTLGRKSAVAIGSLVFSVGAALEAGATNLVMFVVGRLVVGVGEGLFLSTLVV
jgi:MFS family permease